MKKLLINQTLLFLLILLWIYASLSKLINYQLARHQMLNQVFPHTAALILTWLVPVAELITGLLLCFPKSVGIGLRISLFLLSIFTAYILGGLLHFYPRMPCSCGGVIQSLSWEWHLAFNLFFLGLNFIAIIQTNKKRRSRHSEG